MLPRKYLRVHDLFNNRFSLSVLITKEAVRNEVQRIVVKRRSLFTVIDRAKKLKFRISYKSNLKRGFIK